MKKILCFGLAFAAVAMFGVTANADLVTHGYSTVTTGGDDNNQAGPMWGQGITLNTTPGGIAPFNTFTTGPLPGAGDVFLTSLSYQQSTSNLTAPGAFMHVYDGLTIDAVGAITALGNLVAVSNASDFTGLAFLDELTWTFNGTLADAVDVGTTYHYVSASDTTAGTVGNGLGNLIGGQYELDTGDNYAGGDSLRGSNGNNSGWDQSFVVSADTVAIPEPSALALFGMGLVGLAARRRRS